MSTPIVSARPSAPSNSFTTLVTVGILVVAAGLILPRLLSLSPTPPSTESDTVETSTPTAKPSLTPNLSPSLPANSSPTGESTTLVWSVAKLMFGLAIVAGVCIGVARWTNKARQTATNGILDPLAKLAVDQRCVIHLVAVGSRRLLVGTDISGVKSILELPAK